MNLLSFKNPIFSSIKAVLSVFYTLISFKN